MIKSVSEKTKENFIYLINLIADVLNDKKPLFKDDADWQVLFALAKKHSVANLIYYAVSGFSEEEKSKIPADIFNSLKEYHMKAVVTEANQQYETDKIIDDFEKNHIRNMPVKGYFFKHAYKTADMRTMNDVDILFDEENCEQVNQILAEKHSMTKTVEESTHYSYVLPPYFYLEMHSSLEEKKNGNGYFVNAFDRAKKRDGFEYSYKMTDEDAYVYMLYHAAGHCVDGGLGLRMIMDVYVFNKVFADSIDWEYTQKQLELTNLADFEKFAKKLSYDWFAGQEVKVLDRAGEYILLSGTFGRTDVSMLSASMEDRKKEEQKGKKGSGVKFLLKSVFPSYKRMKGIYPILSKAPVLYPFSFVYWWFSRAFVKRNIDLDIVKKRLQYIDEDDERYYLEILKDMGLSK